MFHFLFKPHGTSCTIITPLADLAAPGGKYFAPFHYSRLPPHPYYPHYGARFLTKDGLDYGNDNVTTTTAFLLLLLCVTDVEAHAPHY